ncbi:MAG: preprotein translocase subunit SecA [Thermoflexales bacterium]|nr:preprotein translocase subunit SecA [Thermoflexales bacterium]
MFKNLLTKIVGSDSDKALARLSALPEACAKLEPEYQALSAEALKGKTAEFRARLQKGETLDDLMPEAFAAVREASRRVTGMRHYDIQLIGGALLHQGKIAEMRTGEGKTLVATLPLYLNALEGQGAHLVTQNDYLAKRDAQWMGAVYFALGMTTGIIQSSGDGRPDDSTYVYDPDYPSRDDRFLRLRPIRRREAYTCDITYGTNNEYGFDYLRDNMTQELAECTQRVDEDGQPLLHFAVIDEVDNLLIDEARTPLIISGPADEPSPLYKRFAELVTRLEASKSNDIKQPDGDYIVEARTKNVTLTEEGIGRIEKWLGITNLYAPEHADMTPYLDNALRARVIYEKDRDYVVADKGEIIIVDEFTGRLMYGRRFSEGLHQAIEAKEGVKVQRESFTYATITFQNFFRMYDKLSGMTGTAMTESEEFFKIYSLDVVPLPTHIEYLANQKKLVPQPDKFVDGTSITTFTDPKTQRKYFRRLDYPDLVYKNAPAKFKAVVEEIATVSKTGRPVLVGTIAIETSEMLSKLLERRGVKHEVLNAKQHEREATVIAQAGRLGAVTIATNMAGRGVDILLGGNAEGIARDRLRRQGVDLTQVEKDVWATELANAEAETAADKKQVVALGGLHVIGTERHEARRIDNQLRGRCSRQGDPGSARFFVSLDDELMRRFGGERVKGLMERMKLEEDVPLEYGILSKSIEQAQEKVEGYNFDVRKHVIQYDDVINKQREVIYHQRRTILEKDDLRDDAMEMVEGEIKALVEEHVQGDLPENWDLAGLANEARTFVPLTRDFDPTSWRKKTREQIAEQLMALATPRYEANLREGASTLLTQLKLQNLTLNDLRLSREALLRCIYVWLRKTLGDAVCDDLEAANTGLNDLPETLRDGVAQAMFDGIRLFRDRSVMIQTVDQYWVRHLTDLDELREGIGLRAYGQRDPLVAYRQEASNTYSALLDQIRETVSQRIFNVQVNVGPPPPQQGAPRQTPARPANALGTGTPRPTQLRTSGGNTAAAAAKPAVKPGTKVGRNDVCPFCNSGKKVKHCDCEGARKFRGEI